MDAYIPATKRLSIDSYIHDLRIYLSHRIFTLIHIISRRSVLLVVLSVAVPFLQAEELKFHDSEGSTLSPSVQEDPAQHLDFAPEKYSPYVPKLQPGQLPYPMMVPPGMQSGSRTESARYPYIPGYRVPQPYPYPGQPMLPW